jgi:hypothetical protein
LPEFRSARDTMDRSKLLMSKVDTNKERETPRPASRPISSRHLQLLQRIEADVMEIRGLPKTFDVGMELLDRDGLRDYLMAVASDTDVGRLQGDYLKLLNVLGLTPKDSGTMEAMIETLADHILGFYSPEGKYMVLISSTGAMAGGEKATYRSPTRHRIEARPCARWSKATRPMRKSVGRSARSRPRSSGRCSLASRCRSRAELA